MRQRVNKYLPAIAASLVFLSCTRNEIQFGDNPESNYTNIVFTDTVAVSLSTIIADSFATNSATSLLLGRYNDPYFGTVSAKNFFQMTIPLTVPAIPETAQYDSLVFIFHPADYYYGDTSLQQTFYVNELAQAITYSYGSNLFNTSNVPVKTTPLGTKTISIRPVFDDSIAIRLSDIKGAELFSKLKAQSTDITDADNFLNYFHGISLATGNNDLGAIYGINGAAGNSILRVHYHTTIPQPENQFIDFTSLANGYAFNQVLPDRSGTGLISINNGITEIPASQTNNLSFLQPGTGIYLKMTFPSLKTILSSDKIIRLIKAELFIRPAVPSFDKNKYKLPSQLYLQQTDASNIIGDPVLDSTGTAVLYASPITDDVYGENNYYRFNITSYINSLMTTSGSQDGGFYLMHSASELSTSVTRLVVNNALHGNQSSKLFLYMIVINK